MENIGKNSKSVPDKTLSNVELHFIVSDTGVTLVFVGHQIKQLCGYSVDDFLTGSVRFQELIHPDDSELSLFLFSKEIDDRLIKVNFRMRKKNGRITCLRGTYKKYIEKDSTEIHLKIILQDSANLKQIVEESMLLANF